MLQMLDTHRHLYNRALAERTTAWEQEQRSVRYEDQSAQLKIARTTNPYLAQTNFSSCQATLRRLKKAFDTFFRRVKTGGDPGYPRFKGHDRFGDNVPREASSTILEITNSAIFETNSVIFGTVR